MLPERTRLKVRSQFIGAEGSVFPFVARRRHAAIVVRNCRSVDVLTELVTIAASDCLCASGQSAATLSTAAASYRALLLIVQHLDSGT